MDEKVKANMLHWNDLVEPHARSEFYDVEGFKKGRNTLDRVVLEGVGDVRGKSLLHLQCHFGLDTLSFARLGAEVTGADFSPKAIEFASSLAKELSIPATFVCSDIYDLPNNLHSSCDIVFTSYGVLCWFPDLARWAQVIAHFLKPGGFFYIVESHPFLDVFLGGDALSSGSQLKVQYPYFAKGPTRYEDQGTYANEGAVVEHPVTYEWMHTLSEILNSLISAGLRIENLNEYSFTNYKILPFLSQGGDGFWRLPVGREDIPLMFSLRATK